VNLGLFHVLENDILYKQNVTAKDMYGVCFAIV